MKRSLAVFFAIIGLCMSVCAADSDIAFNVEDNTVDISGNYSGMVNIYVLNHDADKDSIDNAENKPIYVRQFVAKGKFLHKIYLPIDLATDTYDVYINAEKYGELSYTNIPDANGYLEEVINRQKTAEGLSNAILNSGTKLGINLEKDGKYVPQIAELLLHRLPLVDTEGKADYTIFAGEYKKAYAIVAMRGANPADVDSILKSNAKYLGIDYEKDYAEAFGSAAKERLCTILAAADITYESEESDFKPVWESSAFVAQCFAAEHWSNLKKLISDNRSLLGTEFASLELSNDDYVALMSQRSKFYSVRDIIDIAKKVKNPGAGEQGGSGGSGSIGGGGIGGGGGSSTGRGNGNYAYGESVAGGGNQTNEEGSAFADLKDYAWAVDAIDFLKQKNIVSGTGDKKFEPARVVNRAEFAKMVSLILGLEEKDCIFRDVTKKDWFYGYVGALSDADIIQGYQGEFKPYDSLQRQDAAVIIKRVLDTKSRTFAKTKNFKDEAAIDDYALEAVKCLAGEGIINGKGNEEFVPKAELTRAEAAVLVYRAFFE